MQEKIKMPYRVYKDLYSKHPTIEGSYASKDKTIDVVLDAEAALEYHTNVEELEIEVPYKTYKRELNGYYYKRDSYDAARKTIIVYMTLNDATERGLI